MAPELLTTKDFSAWFGDNQVVKQVTMSVSAHHLVAVMGPSGCGKTTFLRCINRMHELASDAHTDGVMELRGQDVYRMNPIMLRLQAGMVFQRPNPFPHLSIYDNVLAGYKLNGVKLSRPERDEIVEDSLRKGALWMEVRDVLQKKAAFLSGGQQQRLCIARAIAMRPEVLLLDEPTSALDPVSTASIEELLDGLKENYTIILVTHNMQQAARISDKTAFFYMGELVEYDDTNTVFTSPHDKRTQDYITGRFS